MDDSDISPLMDTGSTTIPYMTIIGFAVLALVIYLYLFAETREDKDFVENEINKLREMQDSNIGGV